ncbi:hypothetical protein L1280_002614 [Deinococcus sp. HSC-46F16]|uniref:DUF4403 family protein n=1 Tax=Deinococcus sp. HSC-46F16 TaxID=2910968 RepID=UPI0020A1EA0E|nr:DUF4403 family protein [Deinococcus sp. HSC-46F16]MCP2015452.1 hypothetical protein [Deinococcus sp. HSC-46F16]
MRRLLIPLLSTALMTAPAEAQSVPRSSLVLPVTVPLSGVQAAANARVPAEFARLDETRPLAGGLLGVRLTGTVTRTGHVRVGATPEGDALLVRVPLRAAFRAEGQGLGSALGRDFGGEATVSLRLTPTLGTDWQAGVKVAGTVEWTDPLSVELTPGVRVSVQSLVDGQVRAALDRVTADIERAVREGADLRDRAGALWARAGQPWTLPAPEPAYARVTPRTLTVSPFRFTGDALKLTVGATFDLSAGLGRAPAQAPAPLPPLRVAEPPTPGVALALPVRLPYPDLSRAATRAAAARTVTLPLPLSPTLRVENVVVTGRGPHLNAAVTVRVSGPLGLNVRATADVSGVPALDASGRVVTLRDPTVVTRREGLTGRVVGWLADARAQAYLRGAARFDLTPQLTQARGQVQSRLPFTPVPGVTLTGKVGELRLTGLSVTPDALVVTAAAGGQLAAAVDAGKMR